MPAATRSEWIPPGKIEGILVAAAARGRHPGFGLNKNPAGAPRCHPRQLPLLARSVTPVGRCLTEYPPLSTRMGVITFAGFSSPFLIVLIFPINFISWIYMVTKLLDTVLYSQREIICHSGENEHFLVLSVQRITLSGK